MSTFDCKSEARARALAYVLGVAGNDIESFDAAKVDGEWRVLRSWDDGEGAAGCNAVAYSDAVRTFMVVRASWRRLRRAA